MCRSAPRSQDAAHVNAFFRRAGIATLTTRELFDFAVDPTITAEGLDDALDALARLAASRPAGAAADEDAGVAAQARPAFRHACVRYMRLATHSCGKRATVWDCLSDVRDVLDEWLPCSRCAPGRGCIKLAFSLVSSNDSAPMHWSLGNELQLLCCMRTGNPRGK